MNVLFGYPADGRFMEDANTLDMGSFLSINVGGFLLPFIISVYVFLIIVALEGRDRFKPSIFL
jgi:uncharacterized membrane protein